jgi:hypothetical protein
MKPFHLRAGKQDVQNMVAAPGAVRRDSWASFDNAMLVGMSAGGFAVIETGAANPPATDTQGYWGAAYWASDEAAATALTICSSQQSSGAPKCTLYAINNHYASKAPPERGAYMRSG